MSNFTTIGGLRDALSEMDAGSLVYIDNRHPTALSSYRGDYSDLAIQREVDTTYEATTLDEPGESFKINLPGWGTYTPGSAEVRIKTPPTVADLIEALDLAEGADFEGYKGGQFHMTRDSDLWVSEYGQCDRLRITRVEVLDGRVDFGTSKEEW